MPHKKRTPRRRVVGAKEKIPGKPELLKYLLLDCGHQIETEGSDWRDIDTERACPECGEEETP